jgi:hypothetical protein
VRLIRHPDRRQLTGTVQPRELDRVPTVRLDPLPRLARYQRRRHHVTLVSHLTQLSLDAVAARAGLIAKPKFVPLGGQLSRQPLHRGRPVRDFSILAHFAKASLQARFRHAHHDGILVHIESNMCDNLPHDPSPYALRLCSGQSGTTSDTCIP